jgi:hypothetical protein
MNGRCRSIDLQIDATSRQYVTVDAVNQFYRNCIVLLTVYDYCPELAASHLHQT